MDYLLIFCTLGLLAFVIFRPRQIHRKRKSYTRIWLSDLTGHIGEFDTFPLAEDRLKIVCQMLNNKPVFTHERFCPRRKVLTRGEFDDLAAVFIKREFMILTPQRRYSPTRKGIEFFKWYS